MHIISSSVQALTPTLKLPSWSLPRRHIIEYAIVSTLSCHTPTLSWSSLSCQRRREYCFVSLSMHLGQGVANPVPMQPRLFHSSHHVHVTLRVIPPTPCCSTHLPLSHPFCWHRTCTQACGDYLFCAVHCDVTKGACTLSTWTLSSTRLGIRLRDLSLLNEYTVGHCGLSAASRHSLLSQAGIAHYSQLHDTTGLC